MSIQLAHGEKPIRDFDYSKTTGMISFGVAGQITKNLIVTNKRIIHKTAATAPGGEEFCINEMPLSAAKYINVSYGLRPYSIFSTLFLFSVLFMSFFALSRPLSDQLNVIASVICGCLAVLFIILFNKVKYCTLSCVIGTDTRIETAMAFSGESRNFFSRHFSNSARVTNIRVRVKVNRDAAKALAEELGAVLSDAINGYYDDAPASAEAENGMYTVEA